MNPAAARHLAARGVAVGVRMQGTPVIFRGVEIMVRLSQSPSALTLEAGGLREKQNWRIRFPATVQPPPEELEQVTDLTGRIFVLTSVIPATESPNAQEHIAEARFE